jgi:hypothetical protein
MATPAQNLAAANVLQKLMKGVYPKWYNDLDEKEQAKLSKILQVYAMDWKAHLMTIAVYLTFRAADGNSGSRPDGQKVFGTLASNTGGKVIAGYLARNGTIVSNPAYIYALMCVSKPVLSGLLAVLAQRGFPAFYQGKPFDVFLESGMISLLSDALTDSLKYGQSGLAKEAGDLAGDILAGKTHDEL